MFKPNKIFSGVFAFVFALLIGCRIGFSQSPMNQWIMAPDHIDITTVKDLSGNEDGLIKEKKVNIIKYNEDGSVKENKTDVDDEDIESFEKRKRSTSLNTMKMVQ